MPQNQNSDSCAKRGTPGEACRPVLCRAGLIVGVRRRASLKRKMIRSVFENLQSQQCINRDGIQHRVTAADILVVSPINMQVNLLGPSYRRARAWARRQDTKGRKRRWYLSQWRPSSAEELPARTLNFCFQQEPAKRCHIAREVF